MEKSVHTSEYAALRRCLHATRAAAGLSQRDLAANLVVPHSWVAKVESGERRIDLVEFFWFVAACGADPAAVSRKLFRQFSQARSRPKGDRPR
jgi:transcriptional regulator with XRE-family HTH domain